MSKGEKTTVIISFIALIALILHIFHIIPIDNLSLIFIAIGLTPWILLLLKPSKEKTSHQVVITLIACIGFLIHISYPQLLIDNVAILLLLISILPWIVPYLISLNKKTFSQVIISLASTLVIIIHILWPSITFDTATTSLLIILLLPWIIPFLKSLELPGGFKAEFNQEKIEKIEKRAEEAGLISEEEPNIKYPFQQVSDPNLALAGLRLEIEKKLKEIAKSNDIPIKDTIALRNVLELLNERQILSSNERSVIVELTYLLNKAVHGAHVDKSSAHWAMSIGPKILEALDDKMNKPVLQINQDD